MKLKCLVMNRVKWLKVQTVARGDVVTYRLSLVLNWLDLAIHPKTSFFYKNNYVVPIRLGQERSCVKLRPLWLQFVHGEAMKYPSASMLQRFDVKHNFSLKQFYSLLRVPWLNNEANLFLLCVRYLWNSKIWPCCVMKVKYVPRLLCFCMG
jgi:hypothetical protein